jgi:hypothetical protein
MPVVADDEWGWGIGMLEQLAARAAETGVSASSRR